MRNKITLNARHITLAAMFCAALMLASSSRGGPFDLGNIGDALGGNAGHLVKAAGQEANAASLSEKDEPAIGQSVGVALTSEYGVKKDDKLLTYVTLVGLTVAGASPNPGGNYVFGVLDTDEINAFSGPDGYIFVTRGALAKMRDEAELAGVLAHEISHVCHHDGLNQIKTAEQQGAFKEAFQAAGKAAQFSVVADTAVDAITKTGYTQPQEFAADDAGVRIMTAAGYDPHSYLRFLYRLQQDHEAGGGTVMSTHPGIADRVKRVTKEISKMKNPGGATLADRFAKNVALAH